MCGDESKALWYNMGGDLCRMLTFCASTLVCMHVVMLLMHVGMVHSMNVIDVLEMLCMLNLTQITHGSMLTIINSPYYYGGILS